MTERTGYASRADGQACSGVIFGGEGVPVSASRMRDRPVLLWINLTQTGHEAVLPFNANGRCVIHVIESVKQDPGQIGGMIDLLGPDVLCFEYDHPGDAGLAALARTKRGYPGIPILMLTKSHSETLAVWALRARVWDYIVKPFSAEAILHSTISLFEAVRKQDVGSKRRKIILPLHDFTYMRRLRGGEKTILRAQSYILKNSSHDIQLREVANHCCLSHSHLSRLFREIAGITFKAFVLQSRIRRAVERLADPYAAITSVCYEVGFRDLSHFGRVFRRYVGMSPSQYRLLNGGSGTARKWAVPIINGQAVKSDSGAGISPATE